jgi:ABC-type sulfate/molybdate transport systems ATPase subunit
VLLKELPLSVVENLFYDYGDFKVDVPYWEIPDQGIIALRGKSGSGKTSIVRLLTGLDPCAKMRWNFAGKDLCKLPIRERRIGVVFQTLDLYPHMSVEENIYFAAESRGLNKKEVQPYFEQLIAALQIEQIVKRNASVISGGEKQRTALARALIGKPRFLILDEPFSALDQDLRVESRALVRSVIVAQKTPTLLITHDEQDVLSLADKVVYIENGRLRF